MLTRQQRLIAINSDRVCALIVGIESMDINALEHLGADIDKYREDDYSDHLIDAIQNHIRSAIEDQHRDIAD